MASCTLLSNDGVEKLQNFYRCRTCDIVGVFGFCEGCLETCHKDHVTEHAGYGMGQCDCKRFTQCVSAEGAENTHSSVTSSHSCLHHKEAPTEIKVEPHSSTNHESLGNLLSALTVRDKLSEPIHSPNVFSPQEVKNTDSSIKEDKSHTHPKVQTNVDNKNYNQHNLTVRDRFPGSNTFPKRNVVFPGRCIFPGNAPQPKSSTIKESIEKNECTFLVTGRKYEFQTFYRCYTCDLTGSLGCCEVCVKTCHAGHNVSYGFGSPCFCDCGLEGSSCCVAKEPKQKEKEETSPKEEKLTEVVLCNSCESFYCKECRPSKCQNHPVEKVEVSAKFECKCKAQPCTFQKTAKSYVMQPFYACYTCNLKGNLGFCKGCLNSCHKDHDWRYIGESYAFCDCPLEADCCQK